MTSNLYLILHKVRGEPAFDVAAKVEPFPWTEDRGTAEPLWIIPTSGHRAYPWWSIKMDDVSECIDPIVGIWGCMPELPVVDNPNWTKLPDHYAASEERAKPVARRLPATQTEDFLV